MLDGCKSLSASGLNGGNAQSSLSQLGQLLGSVLSKLMQASGSGSSAPTTGTTCTSYTPTSDPTQIGINPCVYYVPASSCTDPTATNYGAQAACTYGANASTGTSTSAQDLLNALTGTSGSGSTADTLTATPASGSAPLEVTFSTTPSASDTGPFTVNFGDGSTPQSLTAAACTSGSSSCSYQAAYTYSTAGTYTATLLDANGDTLASATVSVENPNGAAGTGLSQVLSDVGGLLSGTSSQESPETSTNFPGVLGNILLDQNGATIFASTINSANNSETSGFYGSDTLGGQPQGIAAQLCESTPWASNFLADIIPPSFFDSLCQWGGYQVGAPAQQVQPQVTLSQTQNQTQAQPAAATSTAPAAQAQIWAEPASVPLGARTSIFWNTQGVTQCTETSPDGSFSENSLSGAAATVPLTGATTFTISCLDPNGNPVTDYVTVEISS